MLVGNGVGPVTIVSAASALLDGLRHQRGRRTSWRAAPRWQRRLDRNFARAVLWIRSFYGREIPVDETLWHKWYVFLPVRCDDESWTVADVWRRRAGSRWEYKRYQETCDDWNAKIW
jgi:hypothetical protein